MSEQKDLHTVQIAQGKFNFRERERGNMLQPDGGLRQASSKKHQKNKREKAKGAEAKVVHHRCSPRARDLERHVCARGERTQGGNCVDRLKSNSSEHFAQPTALPFMPPS